MQNRVFWSSPRLASNAFSRLGIFVKNAVKKRAEALPSSYKLHMPLAAICKVVYPNAKVNAIANSYDASSQPKTINLKFPHRGLPQLALPSGHSAHWSFPPEPGMAVKLLAHCYCQADRQSSKHCRQWPTALGSHFALVPTVRRVKKCWALAQIESRVRA